MIYIVIAVDSEDNANILFDQLLLNISQLEGYYPGDPNDTEIVRTNIKRGETLYVMLPEGD